MDKEILIKFQAVKINSLLYMIIMSENVFLIDLRKYIKARPGLN